MLDSINNDNFRAFRTVPKTGVIYVMSEAALHGFTYENPEWVNLGQGAPEVTPLEGGAERLNHLQLTPTSMEYGTVQGIWELRAAVADLYNHRYRHGMASQYTAENVVISPGGRAGLTRLAAAMQQVNLGHLIPDYTAYAELIHLFRELIPIPIPLRAENGFLPTADLLHDKINSLGLGAVLFSNPCNPTGQIVHGDKMAHWLDAARALKSFLIIDEFYAHYHYGDDIKEPAVSAAAHVENVNRDPVVMLDGLTKNWRYPGLRISWTIGPKDIIQSVAAAASFLDGGANHPTQLAAIPLLDPAVADTEARAIQNHFSKKRDLAIARLEKMGFVIPNHPHGSFYVFVSLENMPEGLREGFQFFQAALKHKVICIPGVFFDVDPGKRRRHIVSRLRSYVRISFGPSMEDLTRGLDRLEKMISSY